VLGLKSEYKLYDHRFLVTSNALTFNLSQVKLLSKECQVWINSSVVAAQCIH